MKRQLAPAFGMALFLLAGCGGPYSSPRSTVKTFFEACKKGDKQAFLDCIEVRDRFFLEDLMNRGQGDSFTPPPHAEFSLGSTETTGTRATVQVTVEVDGKRRSDTVKLVKERDYWRIDLIPEEMKPMFEQVSRLAGSMQKDLEGTMKEALESMESALKQYGAR